MQRLYPWICACVVVIVISIRHVPRQFQAGTLDVFSTQEQKRHRPCVEDGPIVQQQPLLIVANVSELLATYDMLSTYKMEELVDAMQTQDCDKRGYLLVDDISTESGMGWSTLSIVPLALHALVTGRILVHASSVIPNVRWAWCLRPPHSPECYFRPWTPCIPYLRSKQLSVRRFPADATLDLVQLFLS